MMGNRKQAAPCARISDPLRKRGTERDGHCNGACCFWPEQVEQGVSAFTLRRTRSRHIHAGAASARTAARFCIGLERKGGRCCTAPLRRAGRLTSWPCPAFMESVKQAQAGSGPAHGIPVQNDTPRHIKSSPASAGRAAYCFTGDNALYQQHRFPHSACTPRRNHCTGRSERQ